MADTATSLETTRHPVTKPKAHPVPSRPSETRKSPPARLAPAGEGHSCRRQKRGRPDPRRRAAMGRRWRVMLDNRLMGLKAGRGGRQWWQDMAKHGRHRTQPCTNSLAPNNHARSNLHANLSPTHVAQRTAHAEPIALSSLRYQLCEVAEHAVQPGPALWCLGAEADSAECSTGRGSGFRSAMHWMRPTLQPSFPATVWPRARSRWRWPMPGTSSAGSTPALAMAGRCFLGEVIGSDGKRYDVQLKGSGQTPYSRQGDGRAALGPVLREYVVSEAMAALGIPDNAGAGGGSDR
jgi:hypothetical protein